MTLADLSAFLFPYRTHLEAQLKEEREHYALCLAEKDMEIRRLRAELASKICVEPTEPKRTITGIKDGKIVHDELHISTCPLDWQGELNKMLKEEEDGI